MAVMRNKRWKAALALPALLFLAGGGGHPAPFSLVTAAWAGPADEAPSSPLSPRLQREMERSGEDDMIPVLVTSVNPAPQPASQKGRSRNHRQYESLGIYSVTLPAGSLKEFSLDESIQRISYDLEVHALNDINVVTVGGDVADRNYGLSGAGITVAVLDSGVAAHPDLGERLLAEVEIVGQEEGFADPFGHGTHVAGIIAGDGRAATQDGSYRRFNGVAPGANVISVRVLNPDGTGRVSDVLAGIDWVISHKEQYGIRILNLSLGHSVQESYRTDPLCRAVEKAWKEGILVITSAGNHGAEGFGTINSPGNDPYVLTVGASDHAATPTRSDDFLAPFSSLGPSALDHVAKPDLVAPGRGTVSLRAEGSTLDRLYPELRVKVGEYTGDALDTNQDSQYFRMSGTSMATPVVSGMAALMLEADPSLSPDTVKLRLMKSAEKFPEYDLFTAGAGFADLLGALEMTDTAQAPALSLTAFRTGSGIRVRGAGALAGDDEVWPHSVVWGGNLLGTVLLGSDLAADSVVWGGNRSADRDSVSGSSVVWGGNRPTGRDSVSGDSVVWGGNRPANRETVTGDSVVWGGNRSADRETVTGDSVVWGGN